MATAGRFLPMSGSPSYAVDSVAECRGRRRGRSDHESPQPIGVGPIRLRLPRSAPRMVAVRDDAGYCALEQTFQHAGVLLVTV
jgi:hypothetical protein